MAVRVSSRELIGRADELALLMGAVEAARVGAGQTVLVAGEAGVGKSRLLAEVGRQARAAGATVLIGGCVDLADAELSYAPIVGALRGVVRDLSEPEIVRLLGAARAELARLLPELGKPPAGDPVAGGQARLFELILGVLGRLGSEQPMLLVLEDLHWADAPSLDLLSFLITNQRSERLAIVASLRTSELAPEHRLMKELRRSAAVQRIELEPLTRTEVAAQVASITGSEPRTGIVDRLYERSQGNPFFVEELLAVGEDALPASLRDALLARVRPLSDPARALLSLAAVAGRTVDHRLLAGVSQLADRELIGALRETVTSHLLVSDGLRYAFRHALLREAVYADLLAGERVPLHAALATALQAHPELAEARATVAAEIAHHWSAAGIEERALAASVQAAAEAEGIYSMAEAGRHYAQALELWERVSEPRSVAGVARSELCRRAAEARWLAGDERGAVALGRAALDEPDVRSQPTRSAFLQERLATYLWGSGDSEGGLRAAQAAVASLPASPPTADLARALCGEGRMLLMRGDNERARAVCEHALSIARAAGDQAQEGQALNYLAGATAFLGGHDEAIAYLEQAVRIAHEATVGARGCPEYENLSEVLAESRRPKDGLEIALEGVRVARELGVEHSYGIVLLGRAALCSLLLGRLHEADQHCAQALELGAASFFGFNALEAGARCAIMHGDFEAADRHLQLARGMTSRMRDLMWAGPIAGVSSELELWGGRPERAVAIVNATLAIAPERECPQHTSELHANGARAHADLAQAARATGKGDLLEQSVRAAEDLERRLADLLARSLPLGHPGATTEVHAALCTAEVARATESSPIDAWQDALETCDVIGHRSRGAYAGWRLAEALLEGGRRDRAEAVLVEAVGVAAEIGFEPLGTELHALARRGRIKLGESDSGRSPANRGALLGLTHRELEVLALLAEGRTNRQIAGQLYITEKTTEHHVSRILGKLDVRTRGEAGAVAHRLGLNTAANAQS